MIIKAILIVMLTARIVQEVKRLARLVETLQGGNEYEDALSEKGLPIKIVAKAKRLLVMESMFSVVVLIAVYVWVCFINI